MRNASTLVVSGNRETQFSKSVDKILRGARMNSGGSKIYDFLNSLV